MYLSESNRCTRELRYLDMSSNSIGDKGAKCLSESLHKKKNFRHLDLSRNNIGDEGAAELSKLFTTNYERTQTS